MSPLRDTVGLVNNDQADLNRMKKTKKPFILKTFRRYVEQFYFAAAYKAEYRGHFIPFH